MNREDEDKEIEATKAPLMDHLIELRVRLIKALAAFFLAAIVCFFFARHIYNVLTWPYIWVAGPENSIDMEPTVSPSSGISPVAALTTSRRSKGTSSSSAAI